MASEFQGTRPGRVLSRLQRVSVNLRRCMKDPGQNTYGDWIGNRETKVVGQRRALPIDREEWKRMSGALRGEAMRRARGLDN